MAKEHHQSATSLSEASAQCPPFGTDNATETNASLLIRRLNKKMAEVWPLKGEGEELLYRNDGYVAEFRLIYRLWRPFYQFNGRVYKLRVRLKNALNHPVDTSRNKLQKDANKLFNRFCIFRHKTSRKSN